MVPPIDVLILCPTRELASQIAAEANVLLKYHEGIGVQTLVGGTRFKEDQKRLECNPCQVYMLLSVLQHFSVYGTRLNSIGMICPEVALCILRDYILGTVYMFLLNRGFQQ